jgi:hypothetical protein
MVVDDRLQTLADKLTPRPPDNVADEQQTEAHASKLTAISSPRSAFSVTEC